MKKIYCPECGGEIIITREVPSHSFSIREDSIGLECIDNYGPMGGDAELIFHCINDREHDINPRPDSDVMPNDFRKWIDEVEDFFSRHVLPNI